MDDKLPIINEQRINSLDSRVQVLEKKMENMDVIKETLVELKTFVKLIQEQNEKRDSVLEKQSETLIIVSKDVRDVKDKVSSLEDKVEQAEEHTKIDTRDWGKKVFYWAIAVIGVIIVSIVTNLIF